MQDDAKQLAVSAFLDRIRARTPARVLTERSGAAYPSATQLELRQAHAAARDAVRTELDSERDLGTEFLAEWDLFEVSTRARSKDEYLLRPDLGRQLTEDAIRTIQARCPRQADLQIVIGDGLSVTAVATQIPALAPLLIRQARVQGWKLGQLFVVRYCRVGLMNQIGELLAPRVVVLLVGERPGLATAESLSAYMAFQPKAGHTDANRNLISNIHARGVPTEAAARRITKLAGQMMRQAASGVSVKEELPQSNQTGQPPSRDRRLR